MALMALTDCITPPQQSYKKSLLGFPLHPQLPPSLTAMPMITIDTHKQPALLSPTLHKNVSQLLSKPPAVDNSFDYKSKLVKLDAEINRCSDAGLYPLQMSQTLANPPVLT